MIKGDIINEVAKVVGSKKEAQEAVHCVFSSITKALKKGDTVTREFPVSVYSIPVTSPIAVLSKKTRSFFRNP